jgi:tripartite-type tricarboxylate transporter receptor subunit TctC
MLKSAAIAMLAAVLTTAASAQGSFPDRPVRIVVPYTPGGSTDVNARILAEGLEKAWKQSVIVENRPGAGTVTGTSFVARSAPDGYTMLVTTGAFVILPAVRTDLTYDTLKDLRGITNYASVPIVIVARPDFAPNNLREFIDLAKRRKDNPVSFASSGAATLSHMVGALVESKFGLSLNHVPYQGAAPALIDVLAGRVDVLIANWSESRENISAGKLKLIAILGSNRVPELPNVQTANEAFPELGTLGSAFQGIVIPAGTPQDIRQKLTEGIAAVTASKEFKDRMAATGTLPTNLTPEQTDAFLKSEVETWTRIAREANIRQ